MATNRAQKMLFSQVYPALVAKAEKKGRTAGEVHEVTSWLTGYSADQLEQFLDADTDTTYADFFSKAPAMNPNRKLIKGSICGNRVQDIEDPLMQNIRYLDKMVDELAKGKPMNKVLRTK